MEQLIEKTKQFVEQELKKDAGGHDIEHIMRVYHMAMWINKKEKGNPLIVALAALLHDIDDVKVTKLTTDEPFKASQWMQSQQVPPQTIEEVLTIISNIPYRKNVENRRPLALEGRIVQDADRLDAIGAIGIARTFAYGGSTGRPMFIGDQSSIQHILDKLIRLKDLMNTSSAKKIAARRHRFIERFLEEIKFEFLETR